MFYSKEVENLREENAKLQEQLEMYDLRKEQMHMQVWTPICCFEDTVAGQSPCFRPETLETFRFDGTESPTVTGFMKQKV